MKRNALLPAILITTLAVFLTGCSRNPVAPTESPGAPGAPGAGTSGVVQIPDDTPPIQGGTPNWRSVTLNANEEGVITVGRFTLWLRKNSLKQPATITLRVTDPEALTVTMEVSPASANSFGSPPVLTANMSDVADVDYTNATMLYFEGAWEPMVDVAAHPNQENVVAHLAALSNCKVTTGNKQNTMAE